MNIISIQRTPNQIAAEINSIKNQTKRMILYNSVEIGRRLTEAKQLLPHGEWGNWLKESVDYSQRTAQNLMKIFDEYAESQMTLLEDNVKAKAFADLTYTQALALLDIPESEREDFVIENDVDNMSTRELQQAIKERDIAKKSLEDVRSILKEKSEENVKYYAEINEAKNAAKAKDKELKENKGTVKLLEESLQKQRQEASELESKIKQLTENQSDTGDNREEIEGLMESLAESEQEHIRLQKQIEELQQQLKDKPIETSAVIEKIPEEVEKELQELRGKVQSGPATIKFKLHFDNLIKGFNDLLGDLQEMQDDEEAFKKYNGAVSKMINQMLGRL